MYNHILNARITGNQRSFYLMAYTVSFANRNAGINLDVQFDEQVRPALSDKAFFDPRHARLVCRSCADGTPKQWRGRAIGGIVNGPF